MNSYELDFQHSINYRQIVQRFFEFKRLYILLTITALIAAYIINKTAIPKYENQTTVLISDKQKSPFSNEKDLIQTMSLFNSSVNIDNEIEIIKSFSNIKESVQRLDLKASIFSYKKSFFSKLLPNSRFITRNDLYSVSPIKIIIEPTQQQATYLNFSIQFIDNNSFKISAKGDEVYLYNYIDDNITNKVNNIFFENVYKFGDEVKTKYFSFQIVKTDNFDKDFTKDQILYFYLNNTNFLTYDYMANLKVESISPTASILNLSLKGSNYYKVTDFLNTLTAVFLDRNLEKKNNAAASTVSFIDAQISGFKDSLSSAEANLKSFRTTNQVMDLSFQGQQVFTKLEQLETEKSNMRAQQRYYAYLRDYFKKNMDVSSLLAPSSMSVVDPILTKLVEELMTLSSERASITRNNPNSDNILLKDMNIRIENIKRNIVENVENSYSTIISSINEVDYRINKLTNQISTMPKTELQLKGIERKFELNSVIYTFLLQKRSEAQITRASSMPDYEVIEPAHAINPTVVSPKKMLNYLIALFLGILLPTIFVLGVDFFNNRVMSVEEIEGMIKNPILGKVFHNFHKTNLIVSQRPNSSVAESFRGIRTNFQFFDNSGKKQVVLFTSSSSGDGKSFCSTNFASVLALNGHKTVLLEFDLRRPKIHQEFGSSNMIGISSYLIDKAVIDDIIIPTEIPNLDLISAGPAAPNPAELIASERTAEFIDSLKEMYDYIIIDSAPVGVVSETFLLMKYTDVNVFVIRLEHTVREAIKNAIKIMANNGFTNFNVLINDMNTRKEAFKYGYDTKYYTDNEGGFFKRLFKPVG
jgi:tyrosine-protein kinase Etk/Wzc